MKNLLNLGKVLRKDEQKTVNGGWRGELMCCEWQGRTCIDWEPIGSTCSFTAL